MKKIILVLTVLISSLFMFSCNSKNMIMDNMSEITKTYFEGVDIENNIRVSISVGQREEPYVIDGFHQNTCDFSLIVLNLENFSENEISASIQINEVEQDINLYFDPRNNTYITDLGYALNDNDAVSFIYEESKIDLENKSKSFVVDYKKATENACKKLSDEIDGLTSSGSLKAECYLKVFIKDNNLFWAFSIVGQNGKTYNVILNVYNEDELITN